MGFFTERQKEKDSPEFDQTMAEIAEIDRLARAYGWEIGKGAPMTKKVALSPDNPFKDKDWEKHLVENSQAPAQHPRRSSVFDEHRRMEVHKGIQSLLGSNARRAGLDRS